MIQRLTLIEKAFFLKKTILFSSLDLDLLLSIADKLTGLFFEKDQLIFQNSEEASKMFFVIEGDITILDENNNSIASLSPGDFFGEESLFNNKPRGYSAKSKTASYLLTISRSNLYTIISECPLVAVGFLQAYSSSFTFRTPTKL